MKTIKYIIMNEIWFLLESIYICQYKKYKIAVRQTVGRNPLKSKNMKQISLWNEEMNLYERLYLRVVFKKKKLPSLKYLGTNLMKVTNID